MKDNSINMLFENLLNKRILILEKNNELSLKDIDTFNKEISKLNILLKEIKNIVQINENKIIDSSKTLKNSKTLVNINSTTKDITKPIISQRNNNTDRKVTKSEPRTPKTKQNPVNIINSSASSKSKKLFTPVSKLNIDKESIKRSNTQKNIKETPLKKQYSSNGKQTNLRSSLKKSVDARILLNDLSTKNSDKEVRISKLDIEEENCINMSLEESFNVQDGLLINTSVFNRTNIFEKSFMQSINQNLLTASWISISKYLNKKDFIKFFVVVRNIGKFCIKTLKYEVEKEKDKIEKMINQICNKYNTEIYKPIPNYNVNKGAIKALELLNEKIYSKLFYNNSNPSSDVKLIYRIFFKLLDVSEITDIKCNKEFWKKCCEYLINESNGKIGLFIISSIDKFNFSTENIFKIIKIVENNIHVLSPAYFSKICGTTGLMIFLIRDCLEYCGIIQDKKIFPARVYMNLIYEQELINEKIRRLNLLLDKYYL